MHCCDTLDPDNQLDVSIVCIAYNHQNYIEQAIESFLNQDTDVSYEIVIHDDASTDMTADLVRLYESQYPDLMRPIYQSENQFQQGIPAWTHIFPRLRGKYVALCEGDDWWISSKKIQMQYEYMESHPDVGGCAHSVRMIAGDSGKCIGSISPSKTERNYLLSDVLKGGGGLFGTNSLFFKREFYPLDGVYRGWGVGDLPRFLRIAASGGIHYFPQEMSCYRVNVPGSWTSRIANNPEQYAKHLAKVEVKYREYDEYTNHEYHSIIMRKIMKNKLSILRRRIL